MNINNTHIYTVSGTEPACNNCPVNGSRCSLISLLLLVLGWPKCAFEFSVTSYGKTVRTFWPTPCMGEKVNRDFRNFRL